MKPSIVRYEDPHALLADAQEHLLEHEALNNIFFGVLREAGDRPDAFPGDNVFLGATEGDEIVGLGMRTPPYPLAFSHGTTADAAAQMAQMACGDDTFDVRTHRGRIPAIRSALEECGFGSIEEIEGQGIYELREVTPPRRPSGAMRLATSEDLALATDWAAAFSDDVDHAVPGEPRARAQRLVRRNIDSASLHMWEVDGEVRSMAAARGPTPHGIRISLVYTPPEHRGNGYASALVAELSQHLLDRGRDFVFLFTDLANPTSNHIYREVGFRKVGEEIFFRAYRDEASSP